MKTTLVILAAIVVLFILKQQGAFFGISNNPTLQAWWDQMFYRPTFNASGVSSGKSAPGQGSMLASAAPTQLWNGQG